MQAPPPRRPGTSRRSHRPPAKLRRSQEGRGSPRPPLGSGSGVGRRSPRWKDGAERGGTGGEGRPTRRPVPRGMGAGAGGGAVTPRRRMEPPSRSARCLLRKRLCRNRTGALRFGGLMPSCNQPAAPIHLFLITLQLLPQGDKGRASAGAAAGPARTVAGKHAPTLAPPAPAIPSSRSPPSRAGRGRGLSGSTELCPAPPRASNQGPSTSRPWPGAGPRDPGWRGRRERRGARGARVCGLHIHSLRSVQTRPFPPKTEQRFPTWVWAARARHTMGRKRSQRDC